MTNKRNSNIRTNIIQLVLGIIIIVLVNIIGSYVFTRVDLTAEKRYSLSESTKEILRDLDDYVYFKVYLEGEFPAGFKRLRNATKEMLDEFRAYTDFIDYEFINPSQSGDPKERNNTYQLLMERGLVPTDLQVQSNEGRSSKIIFPGGLVTYKSREVPVELLHTQLGIPPEKQLNNSVQSLEYTLANTIRQLTREQKPRIAFIEGHGELSEQETIDLLSTLAIDHVVERVRIDEKLNSLSERSVVDSNKTDIRNKYDVIVIAKPDSLFSEKDKFIIDQFIMHGGKVLWLIDPVFASMDSIQNQEATMGITQDLNLEDQLFRYGIRLNKDLIMDLNAVPIPLVVGQVADQPQLEMFPWYYFPLITPTSDHPIVKNLNAIKTEFVSSIDTIMVPGVRKTVLLKSSPYTKVVNAPAYITLRIMGQEPDESKYNDDRKNIAVLLEGRFKSLFKDRIPPEIANDKDIGYKEKSDETRMIVVSDGDIAKNQFHIPKGYPLPLGYDQYTGQTFGNKNFILNAFDYLIDKSGLISVRNKEIKLRQLDKTKIANHRFLIQVLNVVVPVILVIIFGMIYNYIRNHKYQNPW